MHTQREMPEILQEVACSLSWKDQNIWALEITIEEMPIELLTWHFEYPWLWSKPNGYFDLTPKEVMEYPQLHDKEYARMMRADTRYPIDILFWKGRWLILDGLHRLMRLTQEGNTTVCVRKIPESALLQMQKDEGRSTV